MKLSTESLRLFLAELIKYERLCLCLSSYLSFERAARRMCTTTFELWMHIGTDEALSMSPRKKLSINSE